MILRKPRQTNSKRLGTAAVELAFLVPLLAFLFVIAVDWSRVFYFTVTIRDCARNGAAYQSDSTGMAASQHANYTEAALAGTNLSPTPTVSSSSGTDAGGPYVEVTVNYTFRTLTNFPGVPSNTNLQKTVRMYNASRTPN